MTHAETAYLAAYDRRRALELADAEVPAELDAEVETLRLAMHADAETVQTDAEVSAPAEAIDLDTPQMARKRMDRLVELGNVNRWIETRIQHIKTMPQTGKAVEQARQELAEEALRRIHLQDELNALLGYKAY